MDQFLNENPAVQDDAAPDAFDAWVQNLNLDQMFRLATQYGHLKFKEGKNFGSTMDMHLVQKTDNAG